jgi:hypothetical protein
MHRMQARCSNHDIRIAGSVISYDNTAGSYTSKLASMTVDPTFRHKAQPTHYRRSSASRAHHQTIDTVSTSGRQPLVGLHSIHQDHDNEVLAQTRNKE